MSAPVQRNKIPFWALPVLVALPMWAYVYVGTLEPPVRAGSETIGADVYANQCAACHGDRGQGRSGPGFTNGAVFETWPSFEDHLEWVQLGGTGWIERHGPTYGHTRKPVNGAAMPGFDSRLTDSELVHVVLYERTVLAGTNPNPDDDQRLRALASAMENEPSMNLKEAIDAPTDGSR